MNEAFAGPYPCRLAVREMASTSCASMSHHPRVHMIVSSALSIADCFVGDLFDTCRNAQELRSRAILAALLTSTKALASADLRFAQDWLGHATFKTASSTRSSPPAPASRVQRKLRSTVIKGRPPDIRSMTARTALIRLPVITAVEIALVNTKR